MAATSLLISESPLTVQPSLAVLLGLNEAIFLQQVQYWITREAGFCDQYGRRWIYNTVKQWRDQFPFWSESTIKRTIRSLEDQNALLSTTVGDAFNKTKAYTINIDRIEELNQKIVHEQMRASIESVQRRVSAPPPRGGVWEYTEEQAVSDDAEAQDNSSADTEIDIEGQKVKADEPIEEVNLTQREGQSDPIEEVNLTRSNRPPENPATTRVYEASSRARVTETTTTENTQRIRRTTTGDVRSRCKALGISDTSTENFLRRYGAETLEEKVFLLEAATETQSIRNPTGWLHAALKNGYIYTPPRPAAQERSPVATPAAQCSRSSVHSPVSAERHGLRRDLTAILADQQRADGEGADFAKEFLRRREHAEGRASPPASKEDA